MRLRIWPEGAAGMTLLAENEGDSCSKGRPQALNSSLIINLKVGGISVMQQAHKEGLSPTYPCTNLVTKKSGDVVPTRTVMLL